MLISARYVREWTLGKLVGDSLLPAGLTILAEEEIDVKYPACVLF